ncbi:MAG: hypothetical protein HYV33_01715 [Candidatus Kerfeldbacteria bacterium]|nr:hypothetical protein [Candidatus Kerfeldbacteria bacterium]
MTWFDWVIIITTIITASVITGGLRKLFKIISWIPLIGGLSRLVSALVGGLISLVLMVLVLWWISLQSLPDIVQVTFEESRLMNYVMVVGSVIGVYGD